MVACITPSLAPVVQVGLHMDLCSTTLSSKQFFPASHYPLKSSVSPYAAQACTRSAPDLRLARERPSPRRSPRTSRSAALSSGCHRHRSRTAVDPLRPYPPTARPFPLVNTTAMVSRPHVHSGALLWSPTRDAEVGQEVVAVMGFTRGRRPWHARRAPWSPRLRPRWPRST